jgi:hypothetical protein
MLFGMTQGVENGHDIWNLTCKAMNLKTAAKELVKYHLDLLGVR